MTVCRMMTHAKPPLLFYIHIMISQLTLLSSNSDPVREIAPEIAAAETVSHIRAHTDAI